MARLPSHESAVAVGLASRERHEYQLVLRSDADVTSNRISVLAPLALPFWGTGQAMRPPGLCQVASGDCSFRQFNSNPRSLPQSPLPHNSGAPYSRRERLEVRARTPQHVRR